MLDYRFFSLMYFFMSAVTITPNLLFNFTLILLVPILETCPCGRRGSVNNNVRIVGGQLARETSWPWTAALVFIGQGRIDQFCGSSVINDQYVLTAGHCVYEIVTNNRPLGDYRVLLGDTKLNGSNIVPIGIETIKIHPKTLNFDVALVKLSRRITFKQTVKPICLEQQQREAQLNGQTAIVVGWGAVQDGGQPVNSQREVRVKVVPTVPCRRAYAGIRIQVTQNMFCASSANKDSCNGDSGGPLFLKRKKSDVFDQIGIVSFGRRCAEKAFPGVYTRIDRFQNFIRQNTRDARYC